MASVEKRIADLEAAAGGGDGCERCAGTMTIIINGKTDSVTKHGHKLPHAAAAAFIAEEQPHGVCPQCGRRRVTRVKVGGPVPPR